jgi:histone deacetylase 6
VLDCYLGPETFDCARLAAGAAAEAAVAVARGQAPSAAAVIRPPGHHAESGLAMGFCFFNNAAVAARAAQRAGCRRVLVLDNDVHHGNGTQHIFEADPTVLYASLHRHDGGSFFPGTGAADEVGTGAGEGFTVNVPWSGPGPGDGDYVAAFCRVLLPVAYEFAPDLVVLSAGFDAAAGDPLGGCRVSPAGYAHMVALLRPLAPLVVLLEGGYNLRATAESVEACVRVLAGERPPPLPRGAAPTAVGLAGIGQALAAQRRYWRCLQEGAAGDDGEDGAPAAAARAMMHDDDDDEDGYEELEAVGEELPGEEEEEEDEEEEEEEGAARGGGGTANDHADDHGAGGEADGGGALGGGIGDGNNVRFAMVAEQTTTTTRRLEVVVGGGGGAAGAAAALASPPALVSPPMMQLSPAAAALPAANAAAAAGAAAADHAMGDDDGPGPPLQPEEQQQQQADGGGGSDG